MYNDFNLYLDFCNYHGLNKNNYRSLQTFYLRVVSKKMNYYQKKKEELRQEAIYHQRQSSELNLAWWDICDYQEYLKTEAKKYGLIKELKENGII